MKTKNILVTGLMSLMFLSCATNPFTGKSTMALVSNDQLFPSSFQQYNQVLSESKVIKGTAKSEMITPL